jgi:hypothetical protein
MISGTEMNVSRIAQGTWAIGGWIRGGTDERESIRTIHAALDKGSALGERIFGMNPMLEARICGPRFTISPKRSTLIFSYPQAGRPITRWVTPLPNESNVVEEALLPVSNDLIDLRGETIHPRPSFALAESSIPDNDRAIGREEIIHNLGRISSGILSL